MDFGLHVKYRYSCQSLMKFQHYGQILKGNQILKFMKIRRHVVLWGRIDRRTGRQTDRRTRRS
jgi:hypothetical protein